MGVQHCATACDAAATPATIPALDGCGQGRSTEARSHRRDGHENSAAGEGRRGRAEIQPAIFGGPHRPAPYRIATTRSSQPLDDGELQGTMSFEPSPRALAD